MAQSLRRAAAYVVAAGALFAAMAAIVRAISGQLPTEMIVFFRSAVGLLVLLPWLWHRRVPLRTQRLPAHLLRGLAGLAAMYLFFYALGRLPLAEATLYNYATPLWVPIIGFIWLREPITVSIAAALGVGLLGILLILKPAVSGISVAAIAGLASGWFAALAMVGIRRLARSEPPDRIVFYFSLLSTLIAALPLWWTWRQPEPSLWLLLLLLGALASGAQLLLTRGYSLAPASHVGAFTYSTVVFAAIIGWALWGDVFDGWSLLGTALVCVGGALALRLLGKRAPQAPDMAD